MYLNRLTAGLAGSLALALSLVPAPGLARTGEATVVLATDALTELHRIQGDKGSRHRVELPYVPMPPAHTHADIIGGALGGALAASMIQRQMEIDAQRAVDATLAPLTDPLGDKGLGSMLSDSVSRALAANGMDQRAFAFFPQAKADPELFMRLPAAKGARRFVMLGNGNAASGPVRMPMSLDPSLRQLRLAVDIEVREGERDRSSRVARRDVVVYSVPLALADGEDAMKVLAADNHARLRAELDLAVATALALALEDRNLPRQVEKGSAIGVASELGLVEFEAVLLEHVSGRALLWTRDKSLVSIPARDVLTGEALVAARAEEQAREAALVAKDSANEGAGKAGGITKAAGSMKPADTDGAIDARAGEAIEDAPSESAGSE